MPKIDQQPQLEQHANSLDKELRKANWQLRRMGRQLMSAGAAAQYFSDQLDSNKQLQSINQLWQQLQDSQAARAAAQQKQANQQMQAVHAASVLAEMKEQLTADNAEQANTVSKLAGALQSQAAAAQSVHNSNIALKADLVELQQKLAAESGQRSDLQQDLQRAQQQSTSAAEVHGRLVAAQQQLAAVTAERDELQHEKQAWARQFEEMRTAVKAKDERIFLINNVKIVAVDAVRRAYSEKAKQEEVAAGLQVQMEQLQAETAELRRSSAAQISHLRSELFSFKDIGAVHLVASSEQGAHKNVPSTKAGLSAKLQSGSQAAVGSGTMATARRAAAAAAPKTHSISKGENFNNIGKGGGSAQRVQVSLTGTLLLAH